MREPTRRQTATIDALAEAYWSVKVDRPDPDGQALILSCLSHTGRVLDAFWCYSDGSTRRKKSGDAGAEAAA